MERGLEAVQLGHESVALGAPPAVTMHRLRELRQYFYIVRNRHHDPSLFHSLVAIAQGLIDMALDPKFTNTMDPQPSLEEPKPKRTK